MIAHPGEQDHEIGDSDYGRTIQTEWSDGPRLGVKVRASAEERVVTRAWSLAVVPVVARHACSMNRTGSFDGERLKKTSFVDVIHSRPQRHVETAVHELSGQALSVGVRVPRFPEAAVSARGP